MNFLNLTLKYRSSGLFLRDGHNNLLPGAKIIERIAKTIRKKIFLCPIFLLLAIMILSSIVSGCLKNEEDALAAATESVTEGTNYLEFYEGLHITGTPIDVDIESYRLKISGAASVLRLTLLYIWRSSPIFFLPVHSIQKL